MPGSQYFDRQDYVDRHGEAELLQLTDRDGDGLEDLGVLDRAVTDGEAEIDAYVGARYKLPLATAPELLKRIARDIVRYNLFDQRAPEEVRLRYTRAVKLLESIRTGETSLGLPPASTPDGGRVIGGEIQVSGPPRIFKRDAF